MKSKAPPEEILAPMARSSTVSTHSKLLWTAERQVRDKTYQAAHWERIAVNGDYVWPAEFLANGVRPMRNPRATLRDAA